MDIGIASATVKIMRSYDYCHFEVTLGAADPVAEITLADVDNLRKEAARLVDRAVRQYQVAKRHEENTHQSRERLQLLSKEVKIIKENFPKSEWTPAQQAKVKALADWEVRGYDYQDDWEEDETEDDQPF